MFTGSAVRVQAVRDLKLQEGQEIGSRSWKSGRQHPRGPAETRRREGRKEEEMRRKIPEKPPNPKNLASPLSLSLSVSSFPYPTTTTLPFLLHHNFLSLAPSVSMSETVYLLQLYKFISLFLVILNANLF